MELFALNEDVAHWEQQLPASSGRVRLDLALELAWHLRQRDTPRALLLAEEVRSLQSQVELPDSTRMLIGARLALVEGEALWLNANIKEAERLAHSALAEFGHLQDWSGCADAHWLLAWVAVDAGQMERCDAELELMLEDAQRAGAALRMEVADATLARWAVFRNPQEAERRWGEHFDATATHGHDAIQSWRNDFLGLLAIAQGDVGRGAVCTMRAYDAALATGQVRAAVICATNVAEDFNRLNDHQAALEWMHRGLDLARRTGWPRSVGASLMHMAETLRYMGNLDPAQDLLTEALEVLAPLAGSRPYVHALQYQGNLALDRKEYKKALDAFVRLEQKARELHQADFQIESQRGQAHALARLGKAEVALEVAGVALHRAQEFGDKSRMIETLMVLAQIHSDNPQIASPTIKDTGTALSCLLRVLDVARSMPGYTVAAKVFEILGREYAKGGDFEQAYAMATLAIQSKEKTHNEQATDRAIAIQVSHQNLRAQEEIEHHRQLAVLEAKRAESLMENGKTLEHLGAVGQEITAGLDAGAIYQSMYSHANELLDLTSFDVYLCDASGEILQGVFGMEDGTQSTLISILRNDPVAFTARCARERTEILIQIAPGEENVNQVPGTVPTLTLLFAPLMIGERLLGVMTIQSAREHAYGERERSIFRSLCAYGAIALDNAGAYALARKAREQAEEALAALHETQARLLQSEKMAALGKLVAGVSHELNTPLGNGLVAMTTLSSQAEQFRNSLASGKLSRSGFAAFLDAVDAGIGLTLRSISRSIELVSRFRELTMEQSTVERCVFRLQEVIDQVVSDTKPGVTAAAVELHADIPAGFHMNSFADALTRTLDILVDNAVRHGLTDCANGTVRIAVSTPEAGRVLLRVIDNGVGIRAEDLPRVFDPFFTTKFGQGGSGLGLYLAHNMVTQILGGTLSVTSTPGVGSEFLVDIPSAPTP